jgi:opacity protein-like surface antigen
MKRTLAIAALAAAFAAAPAAAQTAGPVLSNTSGFLFGVGLDASSIKANDADIATGTQSGGGIFLQLGYGFTPHFALYTEIAGAGLSDGGTSSYPNSTAGVGHLDLGARYHFGSSHSRLRPFLQAGVGVRVVTHDNVDYQDQYGDDQTDVLTYSGGAVTIGAGLQYFFMPTLALHTSAQATAGKFTTVTIGDISDRNQDIKATSGRINVGLNWFPSLRR